MLYIAAVILFNLAVAAAYVRSQEWYMGLASTVCVICVLAGIWVAWQFYISHSIYAFYPAIVYVVALVATAAITGTRSI